MSTIIRRYVETETRIEKEGKRNLSDLFKEVARESYNNENADSVIKNQYYGKTQMEEEVYMAFCEKLNVELNFHLINLFNSQKAKKAILKILSSDK